MRKLFNKENICTIPNLLSVIRILLIPVIICLYCIQCRYHAAIAVLILSGVTDVADGIIARKFNMVSDLGKMLDPVADKLTQAAVILCLTTKYRKMILLIILFAIRELGMAIFGCLAFKKGSINSAKWYGKLNTVVLYFVMLLLILLPGIPESAANSMIYVSGCMMIISFILYARFYHGILYGHAVYKKEH